MLEVPSGASVVTECQTLAVKIVAKGTLEPKQLLLQPPPQKNLPSTTEDVSVQQRRERSPHQELPGRRKRSRVKRLPALCGRK
eukprot:1112906-Amphidinium_carterae.1